MISFVEQFVTKTADTVRPCSFCFFNSMMSFVGHVLCRLTHSATSIPSSNKGAAAVETGDAGKPEAGVPFPQHP
ncbi:hypothetical protein [Streptomyces sp. NPDC018352]|uniref:hypothetical protein n=1 Tax=Streptomyces sp. NPDC018352 TaxID=3157194 RepID=UPI00340DCAC8